MTRLFCLESGCCSGKLCPNQAQEKKDPPKDFTNSIGMKFVWIPPGNFMMGSPKEEKERRSTDETQHKVTLTKGFYMGVYTVTQEQWQEVMGNNPSHFKGEKNLPVEKVSWDDCQEFIKKLREKDKKAYRLPTEAEWEYACRAGTTTPFHFGETISTDQANYNGNVIYGNGKKGVYRKKTTPVGSFPANAWGFTTCTATSGSGARTGTVITRKKTWLTRKDQKKVNSVCCVAVPGATFLGSAARPAVTGMSLATVTSTSVAASVSAWTDYTLPFVLLPFALFSFFSYPSEARKKLNAFFWRHASAKKRSNRMGKGQGLAAWRLLEQQS